jgi:ornithine cyclodeaminase/alanine dehydrogenase-like protein (mu-crystallin family)
MKFLGEVEIHKLVSSQSLIQEIEKFHLNRPEVHVSERIHIDDGDNTILIMPALDPDYYTIKLVGVAPHNKALEKPSIHGTVILHNRKTLEPLAFFDGKAVTAIRTGAIGGLSIKYLANESASSIGIVGTGIQGWSHLEAALAVRDIKKVFLYNRSSKKLDHFKQRIQVTYPDLEVVSSSIENLVKASDIIVTTTTSSTPVLPELDSKHWQGKHIVAVGSFKPTMQELPNTILRNTTSIYVDTLTALIESGDMIKAKELQGDDVHFYTLLDMIQNEPKPSSFTVFKSVGMSLFDLITAKYIYEQSQQ